MSKNSTVADHCTVYALSSPNDDDYKQDCSHVHDDTCDRCHRLTKVISDIEQGLEKADCTIAVKKELSFIISEAKKNIFAWKAHLLRSANQDQRRLDVLDHLDSTSLLLTIDWAMKYQPKKYRESQSEWFGKRGIPWHITVATRKTTSGEMETLTFVHVFESVAQTSTTVLAIFDDVIKQLKAVMPEMLNLYLRQDNAGCYHSGLNMIAARYVAKANGVTLVSMDFSDPQGGKGACDRKSATIKSHMTSYLNSGHDISTAAEMEQAINSLGGVPGVNVRLCLMTQDEELQALKWDGVSYVNNIQYYNTRVKVWKAYGIGKGKSLLWSYFDFTSKDSLPSLTSTSTSTASFVTVKKTKKLAIAAKQKEDDSADESDEESTTASSEDIFACPHGSCVKTYRRYSSLVKHLDYGKHKQALQFETLYDRAILGYASRLELSQSNMPQIRHDFNIETVSEPSLPMGWALKSSTTTNKRFSDKQHRYLLAKFQIGEQTGRKCNPATVAVEMRRAKGEDGELLFDSNEYLTAKQISGVFSRLAAKRSLIDDDVDDDDDNKRMDERKEIREQVHNEISVQSDHPIVYDTYDLCSLVKNAKLSSTLSVKLLQEICSTFGVDTSHIKVHRKKPYTELLEHLVKGCECNKG